MKNSEMILAAQSNTAKAQHGAAFRRKLLPTLLAACFGTALANPVGPDVVNGSASFSRQGTTLSIVNSPNTIINWQSFSINPDELTRFVQQNSASAVLNRIIGQNPTQVLGALQSNGRVFLINPNGVVFGRGAQVDVNGLVASSLNLSNSDFLAGKMQFSAGDKAGAVSNQGAITTPGGGQVFLLAPNVENSGVITSPQGDIVLAAGHTVQLVDSRNPDLHVVVSAPEHQALNLGQIIAQGGRIGIYGALVNQRGVVSADSAVLGENGKIVFKASRDALLEAGSRTSAIGTADGGRGGEIHVLGQRVGLFGDAGVDASGQSGGGTVLLGGGFQGDAQLPTAKQTVIGKDAVVRADAVRNGDGGTVVAWSDAATQVHGALSAQGGAQGGNGGMIETSGHALDVDGARINAGTGRSSQGGHAGTWLLDPFDIEVNATGSAALADVDQFADLPASGVSAIAASLISGATANVALQATNNISFNSPVSIATKGVGLTALAGGNLTVSSPLGTTGGVVTLSANNSDGGTANGSGIAAINSTVASNGAAVTILGAQVNFGAGGSVNAGGGTAQIAANALGGALTMSAGANVSAAQIVLAADNITLPASGSPALTAGGTGVVSIFAVSPGRSIDLGGSAKTGAKLELSAAELNGITGGTLFLNADSATNAGLTVSAPVALAGVSNLSLTGANIAIDGTLGTTSANGYVSASATGTFTVGAAGGLAVTGASSQIFLRANGLSLGGAAGSVTAGKSVAISPHDATAEMQIGPGAVSSAGVLGVRDSDLNSITTAGTLELGNRINGWTGNASVLAGGLDLSGGGLSGTLQLQGGGGGKLSVAGPIKTRANASLLADGMLGFSGAGALAAPNISLTADAMALQGAAVSIDGAGGTISVQSKNTGVALDLGTTADAAGTLGLSNAELASFKGTGTLRLGSKNHTSGLNVSAPIAPGFGGVLSLKSKGDITQASAGGITSASLALDALGNVTLDSSVNAVDNLAARLGDLPTLALNKNLLFKNGAALNIGVNLDGISGIGIDIDASGYSVGAPNAVIALTAGGKLTQSPGANLGGKAVYAEGVSVALGQNANPTGIIAGKASGTAATDSFQYRSSNGIVISTVNGVSGISSAAASDPDAAAIGLAAGASGIGQDANAPITAAGGLKLGTGGALVLKAAANNVGALSALDAGTVDFANAGPLTLGIGLDGVRSANKAITVNANGLLTVGRDVNAGGGNVFLTGQNIKVAGGDIDGANIFLRAATPGTGTISTAGASARIGGAGSTAVGLSADNIDFSGSATVINANAANGANGGIALTTVSDNRAINIDAKYGAQYNSPFIIIGNADVAAANTSGDITVATPINTPNGLLLFSGGSVSQSASIQSAGLAVIAGGKDGSGAADSKVTLNSANQIKNLAIASNGGAVSLTNSGDLQIASLSSGFGALSGINSGNGTISVDNSGNLTVAAPVSAGSGSILLTAGGSASALKLGGGATLAGNNITLATDGSFNNASGSASPLAVQGRWLVYSANPANDGKGGLTGDFKRYGCAFGKSCAGADTTVPSSGNGFVHSLAPTLSITPDSASSTYGGTPGAITYTSVGFVDGDNAATAGVSGTAAFTPGITATSAAGSYDVAYTGGLTNKLGYLIADAKTSIGEYTVKKAALTVTANDAGKTFDGIAFSGGNGVATSGFVNNESVAALGGALTFGGTSQGALNAGKYTIVPGGYTSANYEIAFVNGVLTIAPRDILAVSASIIGNPTKTYDGSAIASLTAANFSLIGFVGGDGASVNKTTGSYDSANAGSRTVTVSLAADNFVKLGNTNLANYALPTSAIGTGSIGKASLTLTPVADSKTYDGTTASAGVVKIVGGVVGDSVGASQVFASANVLGTGLSTLAIKPGTTIKNAAQADMSGNYSINDSATAFGSINKASLTLTPVADSKTYDGTTASAGVVKIAGGVAGDSVGASQVFASANVLGTGLSTLAIKPGTTIKNAAQADMSGNYSINDSATAFGSITKAALTVSANPDSKIFDGVAYSGGKGVAISGFVNGETVAALGGTLRYGGTAQGALNAGQYAIAPGGYTSGNYEIAFVNGLLTILPRALSVVTASITGNPSKTYDGSAIASLVASDFSLSGFAGGDAASVNKTTGSYDSANAGTRTVTVSLGADNFVRFGNTNLANYVLPTSATGTGTINKAALTISANPDGKVFDGVAYSGGKGVATSGFVNGETLAALGGALSYGGTAQGAVNAGQYAIAPGGYTSGNYQIAFVSGALTIAQRVLTAVTASITGNPSKTYDGGTAALLTSANYLLNGFIGGDAAKVTKTTGVYDSANAGSRVVTVSLAAGDFSAQGATQLANYSLPSTASGTGTIAKAALTLTPSSDSKTYDGGTASSATVIVKGNVAGDTVTAAEVFGSKNVLGVNGSTLTVKPGYTIKNAALADMSANYAILDQATATGTIGKATLTVTAPTVSKTYDGSTIVTNATAGISALVAGDIVANAPTLAFDSRDVGVGKTVSASGLGIRDGANADMTGNYAVSYVSDTRSSIVAPSIGVCTTNPAAPGCEAVLPPTQSNSNTSVSLAINQSIKLINSASSGEPSAPPAFLPAPAAKPAGLDSKPADGKPADGKPADSKPADSKPDAANKDKNKDKDSKPADEAVATKPAEPIKKLSCN